MEITLTDKVALITGAGSGIGRSAALTLARAGATVAVADIRQSAAETVVAEIHDAGGQGLALAADVTDEASVASAVQAVICACAHLHIVFVNAGVNGMLAPIDEMTLDEWRATLDTNLTSTFLTVKHTIPHLRASGGGSIIVTASLNGIEIFSAAGYAAYSTSKAGQVAFAKMAAFELAQWNIRVNAILPGSIQTNIQERTYSRHRERVAYPVQFPARFPPLYGRRGTPDEVADLVLFLASDASQYITGATITIDGAISLVRG